MSGGNGGGNRGGFAPPTQYGGGTNFGFPGGQPPPSPYGSGNVRGQPGFGYTGNAGGGMTTGGLEPPMDNGYAGVQGGTGRYGPPQLGITDPNDPRLGAGGARSAQDYMPAPPPGGGPTIGASGPAQRDMPGPYTRYPPVPPGIPGSMWGQVQDRLMAQQQPTVGSTEWAQSPQGLAAFGDVTSRARMMGNPVATGAMGAMRGRMGGDAMAAAARNTAYQQAEAAKMNRGPADFAGPPAYMGGGFTYDPAAGQAVGPAGYKGAPWYDPNRTGQTMAQYIQGLPQAERDELLAKYQAAGMPNPLGGTAGTPGNPFGV